MTTTATTTQATPRGTRPLLIPVLVFAALSVAYVVFNSSTPQPAATGADVLAYAQANGTAIKWGAFLLFASAIPLGLVAAVLYRRLRALSITAPASALTLVGGVLAAAALTISAMFAWSGGRLPADTGSALPRALADLSFLFGGPAYAVGFALLIVGISFPALSASVLPRAAAWIGLALGAAGILSALTLLDSASAFGYLLPVVRFGGLIWLVFAAALLPGTRTPATTV